MESEEPQQTTETQSEEPRVKRYRRAELDEEEENPFLLAAESDGEEEYVFSLHSLIFAQFY